MKPPGSEGESPFQSHDLQEPLSELRCSLKAMSDSMVDAEERQFHDERAKFWLERAREVKFNMEDLVDEAEWGLESESRPLRSLTHRLFNASSSSSSLERRPDMIKKVLERSEKLVKEYRDVLGCETKGSLRRESRRFSGSQVDETVLYGMEERKHRIVEALLSGPPVIALVGARGIGKTTLARLVYGDDRLAGAFDFKAWVDAANKHKTGRVIRAIQRLLDSSEESESEDLNVARLRSGLAGKKFLLVVDDVWDENDRFWNDFLAPLLSQAKGSKIVLTRHNETGLPVPSEVFTYNVEPLSEKHCWELLAMHAFHGGSPEAYPELVSIGKQLVRQCQGLPLAVQLLGGLLRPYREAKEWLAVLKSELWEKQSLSNIPPVLGLSFHHLPVNIRQCFAYFALFPPHYEFKKEETVHMWMAQNYLQPSDGDTTVEEVGELYFQELISRSLLVKSTGNSDSVFKMHSLVHELATYVSGGQYFRMERGWSVPRGTVHLWYSQGGLHAIPADNRLRTFVYANSQLDPNPFPLSARTLHDLLQRQTKLRALCLRNHVSTTLPDAIVNLKHLRYLDLSETELSKLPESVSMLYHLECLILTNSRSLTALPQNMSNLTTLDYLDITGTAIQCMPEHMGKLQNLKTLTSFVVGRTGSSIRELRAFLRLKKLSVSELQNVASPEDALAANLEAKTSLNELQLEWSCHTRENRDPCKEEAVFENLKPSKMLRRLTVQFFGGKRFAGWLGDSSFSNMAFVRITDCCNCSFLPPLGQLPSLENLVLKRISRLTSIGVEFYGVASHLNPFPKLQSLTIEEMPQLEQWISSASEGKEFPCLRRLYIRKCPELRMVSLGCLPSLTKLEIVECRKLEKLTTKMPFLREKIVPPSLEIIENLSRSTKSLQIDDHPVSVPSLGVSTHTSEKSLYNSRRSIGTQANIESDSLIHGSEELVLGSGVWTVSDSKELDRLPHGGIQILKIESFNTVKDLPSAINRYSTSLEHLYIVDCFSLRSFLRSEQAPLLKTLYIRNCRELEFPRPQDREQYEALEHLSLRSSCDALESFPLKSFPELRTLCLCNCKNLKALIEPSRKHATPLSTLEISDCPKFESFAREEFPGPNLRSIVLSNCKRLKSFPGIHTLTSLRSLQVNACPELVFEDGFPSSLCSLSISFDNLLDQENWSLSKLRFLSHLEIEGGKSDNADSFPSKGQLPPSITYLRISRLKKLKFLDEEGVEDLTSLETLVVEHCPRLRSLPETLPTSLSSISISDCPLLEAKLKNKKGKEWSKISHVPQACIGGEEAHEQF